MNLNPYGCEFCNVLQRALDRVRRPLHEGLATLEERFTDGRNVVDSEALDAAVQRITEEIQKVISQHCGEVPKEIHKRVLELYCKDE